MSTNTKKPGPLTREERMQPNERRRLLADAPQLVARCMAQGVGGLRMLTPLELFAKNRAIGSTSPTKTSRRRMKDEEKVELEPKVEELVKRGFGTKEIAVKLGVHRRMVDRVRARLKYAAMKGGRR